MHTYTEEADPRRDVCLNCHDTPKDWDLLINPANKTYISHANSGKVSRGAMSAAEIATHDYVLGDPDAPGGSIANTLDTLCNTCHTDGRQRDPGDPSVPGVACTSNWRNHLISGRADEKVWTLISQASPSTGFTSCGWAD
jgi:hypothetical protein